MLANIDKKVLKIRKRGRKLSSVSSSSTEFEKESNDQSLKCPLLGKRSLVQKVVDKKNLAIGSSYFMDSRNKLPKSKKPLDNEMAKHNKTRSSIITPDQVFEEEEVVGLSSLTQKPTEAKEKIKWEGSTSDVFWRAKRSLKQSASVSSGQRSLSQKNEGSSKLCDSIAKVVSSHPQVSDKIWKVYLRFISFDSAYQYGTTLAYNLITYSLIVF